MKSIFSTIIGHKRQCDYLSGVIEAEKVAHAYCFSGSKALGKATVAIEFSANLLGLQPSMLQTSPNVTIVDDSDGKISVEQIRDLKQTLSLSTFGGGWKIAIIDGADKMTASSQNALLKTLEEPTPQTVIILIAHKSGALLDTIRSRAVGIEFHALPNSLIKETLCDRFSITESRAELLAQLAMGRPGFALACSNEESCKEQEDAAKNALQFLHEPLYTRMKKIESITKQKENRKQVIENMVELWRMWLHEGLQAHLELSESQEAKALAKQYSKQEIQKALATLQDSERALAHNVQPALALQVFASSFK